MCHGGGNARFPNAREDTVTLTLRPTRTLSVIGACAGLTLTLGACGNSGDDTSVKVTQSSSVSGKPGATLALRKACISTNNKVVSANATWNAAVDSHKDADLAKATQTMGSLADSLRTAGKDSGDASFKKKAEAAADQVDALKKSDKPAKTVDTTTYNSAIDDLTSYCSTMFPQASKSA